MVVKERLLTTLNRRKMAFVGDILRGKDISIDLFMGMVYGSEEGVDRKLDIVTTLKKLQVAEVSLICTGWRRTEDYREPRWFINFAYNELPKTILLQGVSEKAQPPFM